MLYARHYGAACRVNTFVIHLQSATQYERVENTVSFVAADASGSFGILAGHARMLTALIFGLARFRTIDGVWNYIALPGGLLYFADNQLFLNTRRYVRDVEYERMTVVLRGQLQSEEESLREGKQALHRLEDELLRRLRDLQRHRGAVP
jgi:F-type H+-transporting ATPase subunit epsilon